MKNLILLKNLTKQQKQIKEILNKNKTKQKIYNYTKSLDLNSKDEITYVINIKLFKTNTYLQLTDSYGKIQFFCSAGIADLNSKRKTKQPTALIKILEILKNKVQFFRTNLVALHLKNTKSYHRKLIIKELKKYCTISLIQENDSKPFNGCRPKKIKRKKFRTRKRKWAKTFNNKISENSINTELFLSENL